MFKPDTDNKMFQIAEAMVCSSHASVFITGKAGTGKTTFLKHIKNVCDKNLAVVAPTGVAAINAGGTTIHSFFQLPFGPFNYNETVYFFGKLKINNERRQVFRQLELLIIDEISMVRADVLDAIDVMLRHYRFRHQEPFGGVQVVMIGDMYQLSPVVKDEEWRLISNNYRSHYFFDSRVMQQSPPVQIAFDKIYRQQDEKFVELLNKVRHNQLDEEAIKDLERLQQPAHGSIESDEHIILTTHNYKADAINKNRIENLSTKSFFFSAKVDGDFIEKNFPTDQQLELKAGARIMFIKNDAGKERKYFNGKIAVITKLDNETIFVRGKDDEDEIEVRKEKWENIRYSLNKTNQQLNEDVIGSFTQFPLRLAWAVTIHKSQGLTFDKVIIDAGAAFAPGQVYVALSRCTNLDGIVLLSSIPKHRLANDFRVVQFSENEMAQERLQQMLTQAKIQYQQKILLEVFDFSLIANDIKIIIKNANKNVEAFNEELFPALEKIQNLITTLDNVAVKFKNYMQAKFAEESYPEQNEELQLKIKAAVIHFKKELMELRNEYKSLVVATDSKVLAKEFNENFSQLYVQTAFKYHTITALSEGFFIARILKSKKEFTAPQLHINAYAASATATNADVDHPVLHQQLRSLRNEICNQSNIPVYLVASTRSLVELANYLPRTKIDLLKISGFGKVNTEKYGDKFLAVINQYCEAHNLSTSIEKKVAKRQRKTKEDKTIKELTHLTTHKLLQEGKSVRDIALERNLAVSTIESHIVQCVADGLADPFQFISQEKIAIILKEMNLILSEGITAAKNKLGKDFSFFEIKLAVNYRKRLERQNLVH
ncbi:MAG: AAA family ATPase [Flavisolibacter sp.]|nr:AAA family ATPase [Flavisolibacter sp.]